MAWYYILLICLGGIVILWFVLSKFTKPKFKYNKTKTDTETPRLNVQIKEGVGLNLEDKFQTDSALYSEINTGRTNNNRERNLREMDFAKMKEKMNRQKKPKSLAQQIRELPPVIKMLIFDRGLARKEYDFKSKKSWTSIPFIEV